MSGAVFTVTSPSARRYVIRPDIAKMAARLAAEAAADTPRETGRMAASYRVVPGDDPGTSFVTNDAPYARYVEFGTRYTPASAPLGRAMARARGAG